MAETPLSRQVEDKTRELLDKAASTGRVDEPEYQSLQRLIGLAEIAKSGTPAPRASRAPMIVLIILTMTIVSVLIFRRISSADIGLDATVSGLTFQVEEPGTPTLLNAELPVTSLGIEQAGELSVPTGNSARPRLELAGSTAFGKLNAIEKGQSPGAIVLSSLALNPGTRVDLARRRDGREYELRFTPGEGQSISIKAVVQGSTEVVYPEADAKTVVFARPEIVTAVAVGRPIVLSFRPASASFEFARNLPVKDLQLVQLEEFLSPAESILREVSAIEQATLYQESLAGEELKLRVGEDLHLDGITGILRSLVVGESSIALRFSGKVKNMSVGHDLTNRSLMPTTLQWLAARQGLSLFWGTVVYFVGFALAVWNWAFKDR